MHITVSAAILILGLLFLATSKAGLKVLGVVVVAALGLGAYAWWLSDRDDQRIAAFYASCPKILAAVRASTEYAPLTPEIATWAEKAAAVSRSAAKIYRPGIHGSQGPASAAPPMSAQATVKEHLPKRTGARRSACIEGLS